MIKCGRRIDVGDKNRMLHPRINKLKFLRGGPLIV